MDTAMPKTEIGAWFKFYPQDWQASIKNSCFTLAQEGAYIRLLCRAWEHGGIPDDTKKLATLLGVSRQEFEELWDGLAEKFVDHPDDTKSLVNPRQEAVRATQSNLHRHRVDAGKRGGDAKQAASKRASKPPSNEVEDSGLRTQDSGQKDLGPQGTGGGADAPAPKRPKVNGEYELKLAAVEACLPDTVYGHCMEFRKARVGRRGPLRRDDWRKLFSIAGSDYQALIDTLEAGVTWASLVNPLKDRMAKGARRGAKTETTFDSYREELEKNL